MWVYVVSFTDATTKIFMNLLAVSVYYPHVINRVAPDSTEAENTSINLEWNEIEFVEHLPDELVLMWVDSHAPLDCNLSTKDSNVVCNDLVVLEHLPEILPLVGCYRAPYGYVYARGIPTTEC